MTGGDSSHSETSDPAGGVGEHDRTRRRKRTHAYLSLWGVQADISALATLVSSDVTIRDCTATVGRAKALCLNALKGQGLTQHEVFAFADAYDVWDHLTIEENDFILEPSPSDADLMQYAWRSEGLWALEWSLGLVRHLGFPDSSADVGTAVQICIERICQREESLTLREESALLDAADIAAALDAIATAARLDGLAVPGNLHPGVVFERQSALGWLVHRHGGSASGPT